MNGLARMVVLHQAHTIRHIRTTNQGQAIDAFGCSLRFQIVISESRNFATVML